MFVCVCVNGVSCQPEKGYRKPKILGTESMGILRDKTEYPSWKAYDGASVHGERGVADPTHNHAVVCLGVVTECRQVES